MTIHAAADGSSLSNPGPAGWAWYVDDEHWAAGGWPHGTNNMGELTAVLKLLEHTAGIDEDLVIYCDSMYAINSITKWLPGWKRKGWVKADGKPVQNLAIIQALDHAVQGRNLRFTWIKGHAGHPLNENADRLAHAAATAYKNKSEPDAGPGWAAEPAPPAGPFGGADELEHDELLSDVDQVIDLERRLLSAQVRSDSAAVAALLHPHWSEIGQSSRVWSRAQMLAEIAPLPQELTLEVLSCMPPTPDTMLLTWRSISSDGSSALRSSLWVRENGHWQQLFHQGTPEHLTGGPI